MDFRFERAKYFKTEMPNLDDAGQVEAQMFIKSVINSNVWGYTKWGIGSHRFAIADKPLENVKKQNDVVFDLMPDQVKESFFAGDTNALILWAYQNINDDQVEFFLMSVAFVHSNKNAHDVFHEPQFAVDIPFEQRVEIYNALKPTFSNSKLFDLLNTDLFWVTPGLKPVLEDIQIQLNFNPNNAASKEYLEDWMINFAMEKGPQHEDAILYSCQLVETFGWSALPGKPLSAEPLGIDLYTKQEFINRLKTLSTTASPEIQSKAKAALNKLEAENPNGYLRVMQHTPTINDKTTFEYIKSQDF